MYLSYDDEKGITRDVELSDKPITIGRGRNADIQFLDNKLSREHCGIHCEDGQYYVKDLDSKNGTFLNKNQIEKAVLTSGDVIRVGSMAIRFEEDPNEGKTKMFLKVEEEIEGGKGYSTLMRQFSKEAGAEKPEKKEDEGKD